MRRTLSTGLLIALSLPASAMAPGASLHARTLRDGRTRFEITDGSRTRVTLDLARSDAVPKAAPVSAARVIATLAGAVIVTDAYLSRLHPGGGQCGAGEESLIRVLRLAPAAERWREILASCWQDVELDSEAPGAGVEWLPASGELRLRWRQGPAGKGAEVTRLHVSPTGEVRVLARTTGAPELP